MLVFNVCKYVDKNGSAAMLAILRSAGVTLKVDPRNPLHAGAEAQKQGVHPGFGTQGRCHQKSKTGVSVASQKGLTFSKIFFKKLTNFS